MTTYATGRQAVDPSETPLSDRIAAGFAALPSAERGTEAAPYWTTSLDRPTGFTPVDLGGPSPERVAHGLFLALAAVPVGVAIAFTTGRSGSVTVLAAVGLALGAAVLYRLGAQTISRRGVTAVSAVVLVGVLLEVVAVAASETATLTGERESGPRGFGLAVVRRLGDPTQTGRFLGATAILLLVGLAVTAGMLLWLSADGLDGREDDEADDVDTDGDHDEKEQAHATDD